MKRPSLWKERQEYERAWREKNSGRYKAAQAAWYQRNKEKMSLDAKRKRQEVTPEQRARHNEKKKARHHARRLEDPGWWERKRAYSYEHRLRKKYGLTLAQYNAIWMRQDQRCAICSRTKDDLLHRRYKMVVDHDHETGAVRGILCDDCNVGIARLREDIATIESAANYLRNHANLRPALPGMRVA